jgi:hypothetical protein
MTRFLLSIVIAALVACLVPARPVAADATPDADQAQLKRVYDMRMRMEAERRARDNEARALGGVNAGLVGADDPTVTQMRAQMSEQLKSLANQFACNDIKVDNGKGNTQVFCNSTVGGDVSSRRTEVGGDQVNVIFGSQSRARRRPTRRARRSSATICPVS